MKLIPALAGTAVSAILVSATPSQAQFFDPLFAAPAAAASVATGVVGAATGVVGAATGGFFGGYPAGYDYGWGYPGYGTAYYGYPGYTTGWNAPSWGYAEAAPAQPVVTGRSAYRSYRQYRRSPDNPYN